MKTLNFVPKIFWNNSIFCYLKNKLKDYFKRVQSLVFQVENMETLNFPKRSRIWKNLFEAYKKYTVVLSVSCYIVTSKLFNTDFCSMFVFRSTNSLEQFPTFCYLKKKNWLFRIWSKFQVGNIELHVKEIARTNSKVCYCSFYFMS